MTLAGIAILIIILIYLDNLAARYADRDITDEEEEY